MIAPIIHDRRAERLGFADRYRPYTGGTGSNVMLLGRPGAGGGVVADRQLGTGADKSDNGIGGDDHRLQWQSLCCTHL